MLILFLQVFLGVSCDIYGMSDLTVCLVVDVIRKEEETDVNLKKMV